MLSRNLTDRNGSPIPDGFFSSHYWKEDPAFTWATEGTVVACEECGKTWVAYKQEYANMVDLTTHWRPERRFERWRRGRKERRS